MAQMTDEEADRLDEKWTKTPPKSGPNGTGFFTWRKAAANTVTIDTFAADYLKAKMLLTGKTPAEQINNMIRREMAIAESTPQ